MRDDSELSILVLGATYQVKELPQHVIKCQTKSFQWPNLSPCRKAIQQCSDLIDLRLTWREMENLIFGWFLRIFGLFLNFVRKTSNLLNFVRKTSIRQKIFLSFSPKVWFLSPCGLGGQPWPQIWNLRPWLHTSPHVFWNCYVSIKLLFKLC